MALKELSNDVLVSRLTAICLAGRRLEARLILYLVEVEDRRLDVEQAYSSMFDFCRRKLGMSDGAAFRRIVAARLVRRFPSILPRIESGDITLTNLTLLRRHLTDENAEELVSASCGKSKRAVQELVAARFPQADVPSTIRPIGVVGEDDERAAARVTPLSAERHEVRLTVSTETRDKLERARDLMRHRNPSGDLGVVLDEALTLLLEKLEKQREGKAARPRPAPSEQGLHAEGKRRPISRAVRREVYARDGEQCAYVDANGNRCPSRAFLELEHIEPHAMGGSDDAENVAVFCSAHNDDAARKKFGRDFIERKIAERRAAAGSGVAPAEVPPTELSAPIVVSPAATSSHVLDQLANGS
jgi:hypothetical protein